jgi:hypothetical protein
MSQLVEPIEIFEPDDLTQPPRADFDYRPVPILAPVALFLGFISGFAYFFIFAIPFAVVGTMVGTVAFWQVSRSNGALGGRVIAGLGLTMSAMLLVISSALHAYTVATEVPEGYQRLHFARDIATKGFVNANGRQSHHSDIVKLNDQKIFLKGYMYPMGKKDGLTDFILVKDNQECCFGGEPKLTDMVLIKMKEGTTAKFYTSLVSVAGTFKARDPMQGGNLKPVFTLDATHVSPSRTPF